MEVESENLRVLKQGKVNHFASELVYHGMQGPFVMSLLLNCTVNAEMGVVYIRLLLILFLLASKGILSNVSHVRKTILILMFLVKSRHQSSGWMLSTKQRKPSLYSIRRLISNANRFNLPSLKRVLSLEGSFRHDYIGKARTLSKELMIEVKMET
ncbi:unnamed protein product [Vicia faba]|uniref:Uncharacterized protein n=1 Tax=Vicia faba TaxID=3906 RepID=A0AAV1A4C4_VICFA|nr:unnamed protein product [Vicia faba]